MQALSPKLRECFGWGAVFCFLAPLLLVRFLFFNLYLTSDTEHLQKLDIPLRLENLQAIDISLFLLYFPVAALLWVWPARRWKRWTARTVRGYLALLLIAAVSHGAMFAVLSPYRGDDLPPASLTVGTHFFGGSGMRGDYIEDMVEAFQEAGLENVGAASRERWSNGSAFLDSALVPFSNQRDDRPTEILGLGDGRGQFNLIGYSHGGLKAAQVAADTADQGRTVDHLVLIATPIEQPFLEALRRHPKIGSVIVIDLTGHGDPIKAGMTDVEVIWAGPALLYQIVRGELFHRRPRTGHFLYAGDHDHNERLRRHLAKQLFERGLR